MSESSLYWTFDDRSLAFTYSPGWSNLTDVNAHESTLSYTSKKTNATIQFYGKTIWLYGAIGKTEDWNQPVSRYTLDNRHVSTAVAGIKNETSYNELFAYFYDLDSTLHTLVVENTIPEATLFLDYYLVEPIPLDGSTESMGSLQTGGTPMRTSISEDTMLIMDLSRNAAVGSLVGAVIGTLLLAFFVGFAAFVLWRRRGGSQQYHYTPAALHDGSIDESRPGTGESREGVDLTVTPYPYSFSTYTPPHSIRWSPQTQTRAVMPQSSVYYPGSDRVPTPQQTYFPLPSEYQSQNLLAKSITHSRSLPHSLSQSPPRLLSHSTSPLLTHLSGPLSKEQPFLY